MKTKTILIALVLNFLGGTLAAAEPKAYYKKLDTNSYIVSLLPGANLLDSLRDFQKKTGVKSASITGMGALKNIRIGQYRAIGETMVNGEEATTPTLDGTFIQGHREIVSLVCNLTTHIIYEWDIDDSEPHCHVALAGSDDPTNSPMGGYAVVGGHLISAEIAVVGELIVTAYPTEINKKSGGSLGGSILDIDESNGGVPLN